MASSAQDASLRGRRDKNRAVVESIREATGASVEEIEHHLWECGGDVNAATEKLIDAPFTVVQSKRSKRPALRAARGRGREYSARGRHDTNGGRGRGHQGASRGRGRYKGTARKEMEKETEAVEKENESRMQQPTATLAVPVRKGYLEAVCGKSKQPVPKDTSGFLVQKQDIASLSTKGWEIASPPPATPVQIEVEEVTSEGEASEAVDSVADVRNNDAKESKSWTQDDPIDAPPVPIFPPSMEGIVFTREAILPTVPLHLPSSLKIERTPLIGFDVDVPLDMTEMHYLFGTFEGLHIHDERNQEPVADLVVEPIVQAEPVEQLESTSIGDTIMDEAMLPRSTAELFDPVDSHPVGIDVGPASDFRLEVEPQGIDVSESSLAFVNQESVKDDPVHLSEPPRSEKPFGGPSPPMPSLDHTPDYVKAFPEGFGEKVKAYQESLTEKKKEELTFEETRPHRQPTVQEKSIESEQPFMSGPTPSLPSYSSQRHPQHKLPEKVSTVGVTGHPSKYPSHPVQGGQGPSPSVHIPASLNSNGGNPSLPMIQQVPFLSPGMMHNPPIPFPPGNPYYPQFVQYQHQMYHGMYGTYGSFGAPFNHESVGHPAHANPVGKTGPGDRSGRMTAGVAPNQGNGVYDTTNPNAFAGNKDKDTMFLNQQQLPHGGFPGGPPPVRNDTGMFYAVPGQAFTQGFRNQFHQPPGFAGQFPGGGFVAPPHTYHPPGQQGSNFRLR